MGQDTIDIYMLGRDSSDRGSEGYAAAPCHLAPSSTSPVTDDSPSTLLSPHLSLNHPPVLHERAPVDGLEPRVLLECSHA
jgi:hypothetical protein